MCLLPCVCLLAALTPGGRAAEPADKPTFAVDVAPFLAKHCTICHSGAKPKGGVSLDLAAREESAVVGDKSLWERVADALRGGDMPPARRPRPGARDLDAVNRWLDTAVFHVDCSAANNAGRVTIRRLNRAEYDNTVRDLIGLALHPGDAFPGDDVGYGFDNIGDVLSTPPLLTEKYIAAAEKVVAAAWRDEGACKRLMVAPLDGNDRPAAVRQILRSFTERAWRRPVNDEEMRRLAQLVALAERSGDSTETGLRLAMRAVLASPNFLFRVEPDPLPKKGKDKEESAKYPGKPYPINDWEFASRLSYFLWSSMPDGELFRLARADTLHEPEVLEGQVRRMLKDGRAHALIENFVMQWLQLRNLKGFAPDPERFPAFDEPLRDAMRRETELCFAYVMQEDRSLLEFLSADYTFVNERLAKHYGIREVTGEGFQKVSVGGSPRGGLLTQASVLAVTSNPTRTSPVKRGKWVLETLLGAPPPPPPASVEPLRDDKPGAEHAGTLRQRMEQHRAEPGCAGCHQRMDPLGFGLENFDAVGAWRTLDGKDPIDASGVLPGGQTFAGPAELKAVLLTRKDRFARCLAEKMLTYALGRGVERDCCAVDDIARDAAAGNYRLSALVLSVVRSGPFRTRTLQGVAKQ
jgi:hypothetical protein